MDSTPTGTTGDDHKRMIDSDSARSGARANQYRHPIPAGAGIVILKIRVEPFIGQSIRNGGGIAKCRGCGGWLIMDGKTKRLHPDIRSQRKESGLSKV